MGFQKVGDGSWSLLLGGRVESNALYARIDAARARWDFSVTLAKSVNIQICKEKVTCTDSLRFLQRAQASTRRRTLVRFCMVK